MFSGKRVYVRFSNYAVTSRQLSASRDETTPYNRHVLRAPVLSHHLEHGRRVDTTLGF